MVLRVKFHGTYCGQCPVLLSISYTTFTKGMISIGLWLGCQPWVSLDYIDARCSQQLSFTTLNTMGDAIYRVVIIPCLMDLIDGCGLGGTPYS